jgi:hypothetical protein
MEHLYAKILFLCAIFLMFLVVAILTGIDLGSHDSKVVTAFAFGVSGAAVSLLGFIPVLRYHM